MMHKIKLRTYFSDSMSGDIIVGIDNVSLLLFSFLIAVELFALVSGNDLLLVLGLVSIVFLHVFRIWVTRKSSQHYEYAPKKNTPIDET